MTMEKLINGKGQIVPGVLDEPVKEINYLDYDLRTVMDRPRSRLARRWRFNQFQFVSAMGPGWVFGLAVVDLKLLGNGFFYLYDFETGQMMEQSFLQHWPGRPALNRCQRRAWQHSAKARSTCESRQQLMAGRLRCPPRVISVSSLL